MSNDLASMLAYLDHESYGRSAEYLRKPPSSDESLDVHVGQSRARLLAFLVATQYLNENGKAKAARHLSDLVLATQKRGYEHDVEVHTHTALGELLDLAKHVMV